MSSPLSLGFPGAGSCLPDLRTVLLVLLSGAKGKQAELKAVPQEKGGLWRVAVTVGPGKAHY